MNTHSERIPRCLQQRGQASESKSKFPLCVEVSPRLAAGSFKRAVLLIFFLFALAAPCMAGEDGEAEYGFVKGIISRLDGSGIIVNESHKVNITYSTRFYEASGKETGSYELGEQKWVYAEGARGPDGSISAEKVYILPWPVGKKGSPRYDFIQSP